METSSEELIMEHQQHIIRGKRTKRSRVDIFATSSSSAGCSFENDTYFSILSAQSCENTAHTEEDEDMANCLILLAQSGSRLNPKQDLNEEIHSKKFTARKITEIGNSTAEKVRFYVYECKTCNRNFPSFQALGGHRASHKRPKPEVKKVLISTIGNEKEDQELPQFKTISPSIFQQKAKVHECSVCGSEFSSGQALGGHMRKHRTPATNTTSTSSIIDQEDQKPGNVLQLDLNLPAAAEDHDNYNSKFQFEFSSQALVGCHYYREEKICCIDASAI